MIKKILRPLLPNFILEKRRREFAKTQLEEWHWTGCPIPPPHIVKQITVAWYQKEYSISTLIETGTYFGDMVEAQKKRFSKIVTIELSADLFNKARKRFANDKNVLVVQGDSGKVMPEILAQITEPAIFWLDGHYSGGVTVRGDKDCPIFEELNAIFSNTKYNHILLIDDARCFNGFGDYPTIEKLTEFIKTKNPKYQAELKNDIIRYVI